MLKAWTANFPNMTAKETPENIKKCSIEPFTKLCLPPSNSGK